MVTPPPNPLPHHWGWEGEADSPSGVEKMNTSGCSVQQKPQDTHKAGIGIYMQGRELIVRAFFVSSDLGLSKDFRAAVKGGWVWVVKMLFRRPTAHTRVPCLES